MPSQILSIYDALAAKTFTVDGKSVTAKDIHETPNAIESAGMPVRMLNFMDIDIDETATSDVIWGANSGSGLAVVNYRIVDKLFIAPLAQGLGSRQFATLQAQYMTDYQTMLADDTSLSGYGVNSMRMTCRTTPINFPIGSDRWYFGVTMLLDIVEKY